MTGLMWELKKDGCALKQQSPSEKGICLLDGYSVITGVECVSFRFVGRVHKDTDTFHSKGYE